MRPAPTYEVSRAMASTCLVAVILMTIEPGTPLAPTPANFLNSKAPNSAPKILLFKILFSQNSSATNHPLRVL